MITTVVFDCFGVLVSDTWQQFLDNLPPGTDTEAVRSVHRAYTAGVISKQACQDRIREVSGQSFTEIDDQKPSDINKNTILLDYIQLLKKRGYKIGLLSNIATNWIRDTLLTPPEQALFDHMIFSFEVGVVKPDPEIFELTCWRMQVKPAQTVLIDDIGRYCEAAKSQGWKAIVYQDFASMKRQLEAMLNRLS